MTLDPEANTLSFSGALARFFMAPFRLQTYANLLYLALAFPLGLAYFIFLTVGLPLGYALTVIWVGIPILGLVFAGSWWMSALERRLAIGLLGAEVPPMAPPPDAGVPPSAPPPPNGGVTLKVRAWGATYTGVYLKVGETAQITATGHWNAFGGMQTGPEGRAPNYKGCPRGALVARMAKFHQRTCIGASGKITARREGFVWLYQSEGWNAMQNTGEIEATITSGAHNTR